MVEKKAPQEVKTVVEPTPTSKAASRPDVEKTRGEAFVTPDVDIYETQDALVLVADVPGVVQDGVELSLEEGVLSLTAHGKDQEAQAEPDYAEFRPASYYRAFSVPAEIEAEKIEAALSNGVLTVTLPKSPRAKPRKIRVSGS